MNTEILKKYLNAIRLYTLINIILISLIPSILTNNITPFNLIRDSLFGILFWCAIILSKEILHAKTDGREKISFVIPIIIWIITISTIFIFGNIFSILLIPISLITFAIYSLKNKDWILSEASFIFRGFLEMCLFLIILNFYQTNTPNFLSYVSIAVAFLLITNSRNLVGDLRDIKFDKYTFPCTFGEKKSKIISILLLIPILFLVNIQISLPIIFLIILIALYNNYFEVHKFFVITTGIFIINIISFLIYQNCFLTNTAFFIILFNLTYNFTPRNSNKLFIIEKKVNFRSDFLTLLKNLILNKRFRKDVKALKIARKGYSEYAWDLIQESGIDKFINEGASLEKIETNVKNKKLLEYLLDLLAGQKCIQFINNKYYFLKTPERLTKKELEFMKKYYPASFEWTFLMVERSKKTLMKKSKSFESSFDEKKSAELWDKIMMESPYSLRKIAIKKFCREISKDQKILDLGCGTGSSLIGILEEINVPAQIDGNDISQESLILARKRINSYLAINQMQKENITKINLKNENLMNGPTKEKYDYIFLSFVLNHIPKEKRFIFYKNIKNSLTPNGKCIFYQLVHKSKFERIPMWVMNNVPTHDDFPFLDDYIKDLEKTFDKIDIHFNGLITIVTNYSDTKKDK